MLRAADEVTDTGDAIAKAGYPSAGWHPITLPSTVFAGLAADGVFPDVYRGTNLRNVPDLTKQQWWYRGEFSAPAIGGGQHVWLRFEGISYQAEIWLNGVEIDPDAVGTMVAHAYDVTDAHPRRGRPTPSRCSSRRRAIGVGTCRSAPSTGTPRRRT